MFVVSEHLEVPSETALDSGNILPQSPLLVLIRIQDMGGQLGGLTGVIS